MVQDPVMKSDRVIVFDTTLRDGEQAAGVCFSPDDKVEIARALDALHVDVIEAGFPQASPLEARSVAAVAAQVKEAEVCALARAVPADIDCAWRAVSRAVRPRIHVFLGASELHLEHQLRLSAEQVALRTAAAVAHARRYTPNVEFSPMDATRAEPEVLAQVVRAAVTAGATTINLPDTVGFATPEHIAGMFAGVLDRVPELAERTLSFHGQDDLGLATANTLAAVRAGARQVEVAVNGIGERAGNTSLEEVVMAIAVHGPTLGVHTRVETAGIYETSRLVEDRSGLAVPANKAVVGRNAFRHASGIHQDGVIKHRETYEVLDPAAIGHPRGSEIVLGKLSGRHGFQARLAALGVELGDGAFARAFEAFQRLAEAGHEIDDPALRALCGGGAVAAEAWPGPGV